MSDDVRKAFAPYLTPPWNVYSWDAGLTGRTSDNMVLSHVIALKILRIGPGQDDAFYRFTNACQTPTGFNRYPNEGPETAHDDLCSIASHSEFHCYFINSILWHNFQIRFPHLTATVKRKIGKPSLFWDFLLGLEYLWHGYIDPPNESSVKILLWLIAPIHLGHNRWLDYCMLKWNNRMIKQYGNMQNLMLVFHKDPEKPFVKYVKKEFI